MAKILLVEDDNNLREIYEARLQAEGYEIVSAKDGEEALVLAKKEQPDLIIADVMMPRVSGFEMLDIIRNTPELKAVHVVMLTALGQAEDKTRADSLGADRYLVKSQVTLEDIVKSAADVLASAPLSPPAAGAAPTTDAAAQTTPPAPAQDAAPSPQATTIPVSAPPAAPAPAASTPDLSAPQTPAAPSVAIPVSTPPVDPAPQPQAAPAPTPAPIPEPSTTDSQLVTDAVNNLVAGAPAVPAGPVQDATPPSQVAPASPVAPAPAAPPINPGQSQPQAPLTMQPVITPPAPPITPLQPPAPATPPAPAPAVPPQQPAIGPMIGSSAATTRKAIAPLPAGSTPGQLDLNQLLAKEGHSMDDAPATPEFGNVPHMPGNVIAPAAPDASSPQTPTSQNPTDPNSISL